MEKILGRVINIHGVGKERKHLTRAVVMALRELVAQSEVNGLTKDLGAFIAIALDAITNTIDRSVAAWEKRGYWLKADRFRMEWAWADKYSKQMRKAVLDEDWPAVAVTAARVSEKLQKVDVPKRNRLGTPWNGAWERLNELEKD